MACIEFFFFENFLVMHIMISYIIILKLIVMSCLSIDFSLFFLTVQYFGSTFVACAFLVCIPFYGMQKTTAPVTLPCCCQALTRLNSQAWDPGINSYERDIPWQSCDLQFLFKVVVSFITIPTGAKYLAHETVYLFVVWMTAVCSFKLFPSSFRDSCQAIVVNQAIEWDHVVHNLSPGLNMTWHTWTPSKKLMSVSMCFSSHVESMKCQNSKQRNKLHWLTFGNPDSDLSLSVGFVYLDTFFSLKVFHLDICIYIYIRTRYQIDSPIQQTTNWGSNTFLRMQPCVYPNRPASVRRSLSTKVPMLFQGHRGRRQQVLKRLSSKIIQDETEIHQRLWN